MSYDQIRKQEQLRKLDARISEFVDRTSERPGTKNRRTVLVLPGGMGSRLLRGVPSYEPGEEYRHDTAWINARFLFTPAHDLQMQDDVDNQRRLVVPDGAIDLPGFIQPYRGFTDWCDANELDWFVFGWDWRRSLEPTVDFFLNTFLDRFRQRVMEQCHYDPLENFSLVGHSFGGLVVKLILNQHEHPHVQQMARGISVATPFYGYGGQAHRYFNGVTILDFKGRPAITRTVSSMRGPYTLMFLDYETFAANREAFAADPEYPLSKYPSTDSSNPAIVADAFNPLTNGDKVRYPKNYLFSMSDLAAARETCRAVTTSLNPTVAQKFFNIRGVERANDVDRNETVVSHTWDWIRPDFEVEKETPISDIMGPGDNTITAWSARLVSTPQQNVRTLKGDINHTLMMNDPEVHAEIAAILGMSQAVSVTPPPVDAASETETRVFLRELETAFRFTDKISERERHIAISNHLARYSREELGRFLARIYLGILKAPSQSL